MMTEHLVHMLFMVGEDQFGDPAQSRMPRIVRADISDAADIAQLHAQSWQAHYRGILPDAYLEHDVVKERATYWTRALPAGDYSLALIARTNKAPAGFIAIKDGCDEGYDATIEHLHVISSMKSRGLGRSMLAEATNQLIDRGAVSVCLWVFEANQAAIGFYESLGGVTDAYGTDKFAGSDAPDQRIGWHDLPALVRACEGSADT